MKTNFSLHQSDGFFLDCCSLNSRVNLWVMQAKAEEGFSEAKKYNFGFSFGAI